MMPLTDDYAALPDAKPVVDDYDKLPDAAPVDYGDLPDAKRAASNPEPFSTKVARLTENVIGDPSGYGVAGWTHTLSQMNPVTAIPRLGHLASQAVGITPNDEPFVADSEKPFVNVEVNPNATPMGQGIGDFVKGAVEGLANPKVVSELAIGGLGTSAAHVVTAEFLSKMAAEAPEQAAKVGTALGQGDTRTATRELLNYSLSTMGPYAAVKGINTAPKAEITPDLAADLQNSIRGNQLKPTDVAPKETIELPTDYADLPEKETPKEVAQGSVDDLRQVEPTTEVTPQVTTEVEKPQRKSSGDPVWDEKMRQLDELSAKVDAARAEYEATLATWGKPSKPEPPPATTDVTPPTIPKSEPESPTRRDSHIQWGMENLPFGETAKLPHDSPHGADAFNSLRAAGIGTSDALKILDGGTPFPSKEAFAKGAENAYFYDALTLSQEIGSKFSTLGLNPKDAPALSPDYYKSHRDFYNAMQALDGRMRAEGVSMMSALVDSGNIEKPFGGKSSAEPTPPVTTDVTPQPETVVEQSESSPENEVVKPEQTTILGYHGTYQKGLTELKPGTQGKLGSAIYFGTKKSGVAKWYGRNGGEIYEAELSPKNPIDLRSDSIPAEDANQIVSKLVNGEKSAIEWMKNDDRDYNREIYAQTLEKIEKNAPAQFSGDSVPLKDVYQSLYNFGNQVHGRIDGMDQNVGTYLAKELVARGHDAVIHPTDKKGYVDFSAKENSVAVYDPSIVKLKPKAEPLSPNAEPPSPSPASVSTGEQGAGSGEPAVKEEPLGNARPSQQNAKLKTLSDDEFDAVYKQAVKNVDAAERFYDNAKVGSLKPEQRKAIGKAQDAYEAVELERYRRNIKNIVPADLWKKLRQEADLDTDPSGTSGQRVQIILDELHRQGATPEQLLREVSIKSGDDAEVFEGDLHNIKKAVEIWTQRNSQTETGKALPPEPLKSVGPGAKTSGELPYSAIQQLNDQLTADKSPDLKSKLNAGDYLADRWAEGKDAVTKTIGKMRSVATAIKDSATKLSTIDDATRRQGELDYALQKSADQSKAGKVLLREALKNEDKRRASALYIDAKGDKAALQYVLDNAPEGTKPHILRALREAINVKPETVDYAQQLKDFYSLRLQDAQQAEVMEKGLDDYFTHIWGKEENMPKELRAAMSNGRVNEYFQFSRNRKLPTFGEGILQGKTPELDPANVVPFYNYAMDRAIASRKFIKDLSEVTMDDGRPAVAPSGVRNAIKEGGEPAPLLIRPRAKGKLPVDRETLPEEKERLEQMGDYQPVDHPAMRKWKWAGTDEHGQPILYQGDLLVHPDLYKRIRNMMDRGQLTPSDFGRAALRASSEIKGLKLGAIPSFFHQLHVGLHAAWHWTNPLKAKAIDWETPETKYAVEQGHLKLAPDPSELAQFSEGVASSGIAQKIPLLGTWSKAYGEYLFGDYIPRLKLATFQNALQRAKSPLTQTGRDLKAGKITEEQVAARVGDAVNNAYGELNQWFLGKNGRNPVFQRILRVALLAPDFGEARLRFVGKALTKHGTEERLALLTMATTMYVVARAGNMLSHGDPEMDWRHAFAVKVGNHWWSARSVIGDVDHAVSDFGGFVYNRLNPLYTRTLMDMIYSRDIQGNKLSPSQKVSRLAEQAMPIPLSGLTAEDKRLWESFVNGMGASNWRDYPQKDLHDVVTKWKKDSGNPKLIEQVERAEKESLAPSAYSPLKQALRWDDVPRAEKEYQKLLATGHKPGDVAKAMAPFTYDSKTGATHPKPFTGSAKTEAQFVNSLSASEKKTYDAARKEQTELWQKFQKIDKTVKAK